MLGRKGLTLAGLLLIAAEDLDLISFAETGQEAWRAIRDFYDRAGAEAARVPKLR